MADGTCFRFLTTEDEPFVHSEQAPARPVDGGSPRSTSTPTGTRR